MKEKANLSEKKVQESYVGKYIGEKTIESISFDWEISTVTFEGGKTTTYPVITLEYVVSNDPLDESSLQRKRAEAVADAILRDVFDKHDVCDGDLNLIMQIIRNDWDNNLLMAQATTFGTLEDPKNLHQAIRNIRVSDINRVKGLNQTR